MKLFKKTLSGFIRIFIIILFISLVLRASAAQENCAQNLSGQERLIFGGLLEEESRLQTLSGQGKFILVVFDFESLSCELCLDSFKNFCEELQSKGQQNSAVGILTYRNLEGKKGLSDFTKIIEKKLRGFIIGNNIEFPILLDKFRIFEEMNFKEAVILLFDFSKGMLKKYTFPLTKKQLEEIFSVQEKD
jgi:hypothetical protein